MTLLEALIVVALVAMIAGLSFPSVTSGLDTLRLRSASDSIVSFLVEHGAALNVTTKQGFSPLDIAMGKASLGALPIPKPTTLPIVKVAPSMPSSPGGTKSPSQPPSALRP